MVRPNKEKMADGSTWYACAECEALYEDKVSANLCCKDDIETLER